jgi:hypothetical protein
MARRKSRFLQTPIEPFVVESGLTADQMLLRMERISFQGRMPGALSAGGLRLIVAHLIANRYVDCLAAASCATNAASLLAGLPSDDPRRPDRSRSPIRGHE